MARIKAESLATEHQIQAAFIERMRILRFKYHELFAAFAVPNAAKRSYALAARMKKEGLEPGVPDWILPVPADHWSGLAIEFKSAKRKAKLSDAQKEKILVLEKYGWLVHICTSSTTAERAVLNYLELRRVPPF